MAKKNPAVLWNVDQTGDVIGSAGRQRAQKNIGITDGEGKLIGQSAANSFMTSITLDDSNELKAVFGRPTLANLTPDTDHKNFSIGTNSETGAIEAQDLKNPSSSTDGNGTTYVSSVQQASNGKVSYKTQTITRALDDGETAGITPLLTTTYDSYEPVKATNVAVTPTGLWNAIETLDVDNLQEGDAGYDEHKSHITGFGADKTLATLTETDGKIAATFQSIAIGGSAITLGADNQAVVTNGTNNLTTEDLSVNTSTPGSDTNTFVSSVTANAKGKITVTTSALSSATSSAIGGIQLGYTAPSLNLDKKYAVQMDTTGDNAGKAYVQVPWQDTHYTSYNIICSSSSGTIDGAVTASDTAYLNHKDNGIVTSSHQILGSGVIVTADNSGNLTLTSSLSTFSTVQGTSNITTLNIDSVTKQLSHDGTPFGYYAPPVISAEDVGKVLTVTGSSGSYSVEWAGSIIELDRNLSKTSTKGLENRGIYEGIGMPNVYVRNITSGLTAPKLIHGCQTSNDTTNNIITIAVNTSTFMAMTLKFLVSIVDSDKSYTYILDMQYQNVNPTWPKTSLLSIGPDHAPGWAIYHKSSSTSNLTIAIGRVIGSSETVPAALNTVAVSVYPLMVDGGAVGINVDTDYWSSAGTTILPTVVPSGTYSGVGSDSYPVYVDQYGEVKEVGIVLENAYNHDLYNIGTTHNLVINENWLNSSGSWWNNPELIQPLCEAMFHADTIAMYSPFSYSSSTQYMCTGCSSVYSHAGSGETYVIYRYEFYSGTRVTRYHIARRYNTTTEEVTWEQSGSSAYPFSESFNLVDTSGTYGNMQGTIYLL